MILEGVSLLEEKLSFISDGNKIEIDNNQVRVNNKLIFKILERTFDIIASLFGLVFLAPVFLVVYIFMQKEEPGSSFIFTQKRVGKNNEVFKMYKIRSMCVDAEQMLDSLMEYNEVEGAMFKMKEDPRVTKIGKRIRKTSIDELPQLFNVLKGDMSLIGPRPPLEREVAIYSNYDKQRLLIKPGCTGLWQISGRNDVGFSEMVELDIEYINNQSILLDLQIILRTIKIMIIPNSAY